MKNRILVVDDESKICEYLSQYLQYNGYDTMTANDGFKAIETLRANAVDVVLLDIRMPGKDGIQTLEEIKNEFPAVEILMATAIGEVETAISCMQKGASGFHIKPINLNHLLADIVKAVAHKKLVEENLNYKNNLETLVRQRTSEVLDLNAKLKSSFLESIKILIGLIEIYDPFLGGHSKRIAYWASKLSAKLGLAEKDKSDLQLAALLHDIGTISLPDKLKHSKFDELLPEEIRLIRNHTLVAQQVMSPSMEFEVSGKLIRSHLERLDGSGFPDGLSGKDIPYGSKVIGILNSFDEMVKRRRFSKETLFSEESTEKFAFKRLFKKSGVYYDADIVLAFQEVVYEHNYTRMKKCIVPLDKLKVGMRLANNIFSVEGKLLLAKENILNEVEIKKLIDIYAMELMKQKILVYKEPTNPDNV